MQGQGNVQICVYKGEINTLPHLIHPGNGGFYELVVGTYFCIDVLENGKLVSATWRGDFGDLVKEYTLKEPLPNPPSCHLVTYDSNEVRGATVFSGVWWKAGQKTIQIITAVGNFQVRFRVSAPVWQPQFTLVQIGKPLVGQFSLLPTDPPATWLVLAGAEGRQNRHLHGFNLTYAVDLFQPGGTIAIIQLVQTDRSRRFDNGRRNKVVSNGFVLDNGLRPNSYTYSQRVAMTQNQETLVSNNDGPASKLDPSLVEISINDRFQTFLMFRPGGDPDETTWVPLYVLPWNWKARASRAQQNWILQESDSYADPRPTDLTNNNNISADMAFPSWNMVVTLLKEEDY